MQGDARRRWVGSTAVQARIIHLIAARLRAFVCCCCCCQFDEKLGNGAYKDVYLAYDTETGKEVAWSAAGESREKQWGKRARAAQTCNHLLIYFIVLSLFSIAVGTP